MPIARLYETEQQAHDAAAKLGSELPGTPVQLLTPSAAGDAAATLVSAGFSQEDAAAYGNEVGNGRSMVAISPPYGQGIVAKSVLAEFGPIPPAAPVPSDFSKANARYTPFSEFLGLSMLTNRRQQAWFWGAQLKRYDIVSLGQPRLKRYDIVSLGQPRLKRYDVASLGQPRIQRNYNLSFGIPRLQRNYNMSFGIPRLMRR